MICLRHSERVSVINILGVPFHYGQRNKEVALAPQALMERGLREFLQKYQADVLYEELVLTAWDSHEQKISRSSEMIRDRVFHEMKKKSFLLNVGGDHGLALGSVSGVLDFDPSTVVIWVDAHGDVHTPESSESQNFHGMPLSYLLGLNSQHKEFSWIKSILSPKKLIYFGPRDLDVFESRLIQDLGIQCFSSEQMNEKGAAVLLKEALKLADPHHSCPIHLSFDLDVFDESDFQATGLALPLGPQVKEVFELASLIARTGRLNSMDLVEYHPDVFRASDPKHSHDIIFKLLDQIFPFV